MHRTEKEKAQLEANVMAKVAAVQRALSDLHGLTVKEQLPNLWQACHDASSALCNWRALIEE